MKTKLNIRWSFLFALSFLALLSLSEGCKKESDNSPAAQNNPSQAGNVVSIQGMAFSPAAITVAVNTTVIWTNNDNVDHTVTSDNGTFSSPTLNAQGDYLGGGSFSFQFTEAGTFLYHCSLHPSMTGAVTVK